jgi:YidC/Oxa1 family membrane protein insertase
LDFKRLSIAFILSAAVLILWPKIFPPPPAPGPGKPAAVPAAAPASAGAVPASSPVPAAARATEPIRAEKPGATVPPVSAAEARDVVVSTALYEARLSNRGGDLVSWTLRRFKDASGKDLDLVRRSLPFPGRIARLDPADPFTTRAATALYQVTRETKGLDAIVRFHYRETNGEGIVRTWTFGPGYVVGLAVQREGSTLPVGIVLGPGIGNPSEEELKTSYTKPGATIVLRHGGSVDRKAKDGLKETVPEGQDVVVAGLEDNYFLTAFLPRGSAAATLRPVKIQSGKEEPLLESEVVLAGAGAMEAELFLGPKDLDLLEKLRPGMDKLIDYGWFAILAKPLLWVLKWIQVWVVNWGVAIIGITILIKIVLFPLTYKQLVSMKKMSVLQPRVETIRAKWSPKLKSDPQARVKMNEETMGLYKAEGVNPAGGCLPLVLQMPILIAFYQMLAHAIELRHAPFALWIQDLSAKDPYYVTPILMTATMWIQQQMTPSTGDATQKKILAAMPLVFGFMFKDMPSGLVLYWLVQNVLTIGQQLLLNRYTDLGPVSAPKKA